jgi:ABC-type transport system involved in multi-copper enzyme maturation permease subunit
MFASYWYSLDEALSRRVAHVVLGLAMLVAVIFNLLVHIHTGQNGALAIAIGSQPGTPPALAVPAVLESELNATGPLWLMLAICAAVPLLTATLEKGWLEMTFSKGTRRWRIFLGRFLGGMTLYGLAFLLATFPLAARLWWTTGIATWQVAAALAIQSFSFAALLSMSTLAALPQKGVALPIVASAGLLLLSGPLFGRQESFYHLFSSHAAHEIFDWAYRILPKVVELQQVSVSLVQSSRLESWWWPFWSTGLFTLAMLSLSVWLLERKSF